jgi:hypothetical protein
MRLTIESIEDGVAVLEGDDEYLELPADCLPSAAHEGAVLHLAVQRMDDVAQLTLTLAGEASEEPPPQLHQLGARRHAQRDREGPGS